MNYPLIKEGMMKYFLLFLGYLLLAIPSRAQRDCRSFDYRPDMLKKDSRLASNLAAIEQFTRSQLQSPSVAVTGQEPTGAVDSP